MSSWGPEGPPPEAYGRESDPERFRGLHNAGRDLFDDLAMRYLVDRESFLDHGRPSEPEPGERLVPAVAGASPLALTYTKAPGLVVRWGRDQHAQHIPYCGCDACDETHESCLVELLEIARVVTAGVFGEQLTIVGDHWQRVSWTLAPDGQRLDSRHVVDGDQAEQLLAQAPDGELTWAAWTRRDTASGRW